MRAALAYGLTSVSRTYRCTLPAATRARDDRHLPLLPDALPVPTGQDRTRRGPHPVQPLPERLRGESGRERLRRGCRASRSPAHPGRRRACPGAAPTGALAPEPPARGESREVGGELQASLDDPGAPPSAADLALEDHTPRPPPLPPSSRRDELRLGDEATHVEDVPLEPAELPAASGPRDVAYALPADLPPPAPLAQAAEPAPGQGVARAEGDARPRRAVRLGAAAMNALSLALLVGLAAALAGWRGELGRRFGGGRAEAVTTARVTGGLFDTAEGARVLVVRGEVEAHQPMDGVRVRVALLEGARTVAAAEGLAGAAADPEQVFAATNLAQIATLRSALDARAAGPLAPGTRAPFLVVFPAPLPDLAGLEVRATAEPIHRH